MGKSELLATEIETKKIEILQERIDGNSKLINDLTNKINTFEKNELAKK